MEKYIVIEIQVSAQGDISTLPYAFDNKDSALAKYYTILGAAAVSSLPCHSCTILTPEALQIRNECIKHVQNEEEVVE